VTASYAISVRRARTLPATFFRFRVTPDTFAVRPTVPTIRVRSGLAPPSQRSTTTVDHMSLARHAPYQAHTWESTAAKAAVTLGWDFAFLAVGLSGFVKCVDLNILEGSRKLWLIRNGDHKLRHILKVTELRVRYAFRLKVHNLIPDFSHLIELLDK
jgi:hypothetical protein